MFCMQKFFDFTIFVKREDFDIVEDFSFINGWSKKIILACETEMCE